MADEPQNNLEKAAERLADAAEALGALNPLIPIIGGLIRAIASEARRVGIDPGPFEAQAARVDAVATAILDADAAYRQRHPEAPPAP